MTQLLFANNAQTTLAGAVTNVATVLSVAPGSGALFPSPGAGQAFLATLVDAATGLVKEIVLVTARAVDVMTIVRAQEGTAAVAWNAGDAFALFVTAGTLNAFAQGGIFVHGQCQLQFVSTTQIKLATLNGQNIVINGVTFSIPAAGVLGANTGVFVNGVAAQNLAASTVYFVYLFNNAGVLTLDYSTTAHSTDSSVGNVGIEIKTGDSTRTLVGMIATNGSSQFSDVDGQRNVLSWFNRRRRSSKTAFTATRTSTSAGAYAEVNTEIRNTFLSWATEYVEFLLEGEHQIGSTIGNLVNTGVGFDSTTAPEPEQASYQGYAASATGGNASLSGRKTGLAEATSHFATLLAQVTGTTPTATYLSAAAAGHIPIKLTVTING